MKPHYAFSAASCLSAVQGTLASAQHQHSPGRISTPSNTHRLLTSSQTGGAALNVPVCGAGFTYCGYILRDHKNFQENDIVKAYCAAHKSNCVNGTAKTDPIQALYICVPPNANPIEAWAGSSSVMGDKTSHIGKSQNYKTHNRLFPRNHHTHDPPADDDAEDDAQSKSKRFHHHIFNPTRNRPIVNHYGGHSLSRNPSSASTFSAQQSTIPSSPPPIPSSSPDDSSSSSDGGIDTSDCASSATKPGNKIELLCACGRQCLNPLSDHIGRCDIPCSS